MFSTELPLLVYDPDFWCKAPLGMKDTFSLPNPARRTDPRIAHSYVEGKDGVELHGSDPLDNVVGSGSIYSTVGDMALYGQALYTERLVKASTLAEAFESGRLNDGRKTGYGFGWEVSTHSGVPYESAYGGLAGFYRLLHPLPRAAVVGHRAAESDLRPT